MFTTDRIRYRELIDEITTTLTAMALDGRAFPGIAAEQRLIRSTASSPSLRSRESAVVQMGRNTPDLGGGNVRVVVRVRGFLPRGLY